MLEVEMISNEENKVKQDYKEKRKVNRTNWTITACRNQTLDDIDDYRPGTMDLHVSMARKLSQAHLIAITLCIVVFVLVLYMLFKIFGKRSGRRVFRLLTNNQKIETRQKGANVHVVLPEFPHGTLSETFIQPELFNQMPKIIEDDALSSDCSQYYAGTLHVNLRYDITRSVLTVVLLKARDLPTKEGNEINYYVITNLFPQKHRPCQSAVYKTSSPEFQESFEFTIAIQYLLLQSLKFSLWSFDRFSHHEITADTLVHLRDLERYGLSICRDISLAKTLKLVLKVSDVCGEIFFSLGYLRLTHRLAVVIIKVINLANINDEPPDPFVEVSLLRKDRKIKVQRTSTKKKEKNPKYNETLTFDVPVEHLHESSLLLCVLSKTKDSYLEENLGKVLLGADGSGENFDHWEEMRTGTKPKARWHKLRKHF